MKLHKVITLCLVAIGGPLAAQEQDPRPDYASMSDAELAETVRQAGDNLLDDSCGRAEPLLTEMYSRHRDERVRPSLLLAQAFCADKQGNYRRAADSLAAFEKYEPFAVTGMALYLDDRLDDPAAAIARLERFAKDAGQDQGDALDSQRFFVASRLANAHGRGDDFASVALQLFQAPVYAGFDADLQGAVASSALKAAVLGGDPRLVDDVLEQIRSPAIYAGLLSMRIYEPAWPQIERRVGEHYSAIASAYRDWTQARLETDPDDRDRFSDATRALYYDGRFEEAAALARPWRERQGSPEAMEEGDGWALNIEAYALDALGRTSEADAVFDAIATLSPDDRPWLVNFVINRGSRLVGQKRWAEGLRAAQLARDVAEKWGTPYAKMLIAHDHACALHGLGREAEAEAELPYLRENSDEAVSVAAQALMCLGRRDEALALLLAGLDSERTRASVIDDLLPDSYDLFYTASLLPDPSEFLAESPELRAAFEKWARPIPERFVPAASLKRVPPAR